VLQRRYCRQIAEIRRRLAATGVVVAIAVEIDLQQAGDRDRQPGLLAQFADRARLGVRSGFEEAAGGELWVVRRAS